MPVAIVGATNAGKSSLLNALSHDDRAIVSDVHGTTRDVVEDVISIGDYTFRLKDTAGFRHTSDVVESLEFNQLLAGGEFHVFLAEIEFEFEQRREFEQLATHVLDAFREVATHLAERYPLGGA